MITVDSILRAEAYLVSQSLIIYGFHGFFCSETQVTHYASCEVRDPSRNAVAVSVYRRVRRHSASMCRNKRSTPCQLRPERKKVG